MELEVADSISHTAAPESERCWLDRYGSIMAQKILVVDDEPEIVKLVRSYLERTSFTVVAAYEGQ